MHFLYDIMCIHIQNIYFSSLFMNIRRLNFATFEFPKRAKLTERKDRMLPFFYSMDMWFGGFSTMNNTPFPDSTLPQQTVFSHYR